MTEGATARQAWPMPKPALTACTNPGTTAAAGPREGRLPFDEPLQYSAAQVAHIAISDAQQPGSRPIELHLLDASAQRLLAMPPTLAIAALRNLLDNAQRHNSADTAVSLSVQFRGEDVCFSVQDAGPGVAPEKATAADRALLAQLSW